MFRESFVVVGMHMKKLNDKQNIVSVTREIRLQYYNDYLYKKGVITKREHDAMFHIIIESCYKAQK